MVDSDRGFAHLGQGQTAAGYTFLAWGTGWRQAVGSVSTVSESASHSSSTRNVQLCCHSSEPGSSGSWNDQVQAETLVRMSVLLLCVSHAEPSAHCLITNVFSAPVLPVSPASPATPGSFIFNETLGFIGDRERITPIIPFGVGVRTLIQPPALITEGTGCNWCI